MNDKKSNFRCGFVSIVGRPNVGKSTLLNSLIGEKVAIVSKVPQTTRNQIRGIYNDQRGQIIFIDTPGMHAGKDKLDKFMNNTSSGTITEADCIIYLVDTTRAIGEEEENVAAKLKSIKAPVILGLNKVDVKKHDVEAYISFWETMKGELVNKMKNFTLIALSGEKEKNTDKLLDVIFDYLPEGKPLYPDDIICDVPQRQVIADIIREKLINLLRKEVPHSVGVVIEHMQARKRKAMHIKAVILIERPTQKEIVIGKGGSLLKEVGTQARMELEEMFEMKIFLELYVKVRKDWRDSVDILQELGYSNM